ncbi:MAG: chemotaxis protein CheB [Rhodoferax sp.]|nr:chemotaxis protein CheB [Rhodoferax sp.]
MTLQTLAPALLKGPVEAIVIGASAGGVEALMALLPALPAGLAAAVFVVLHLPRDRPSLLVEIFRQRCALRVTEAQDKERVANGTVYFAPPDYHLLVDAGPEPQLALSVDEPVHYSRPSIDVLFESAADVYGDRLMGIVLTGGNQDGAAGLASVRRAGGITVVQDPATAQVALMPQSALDTGPVDHVLPLPEMVALLHKLNLQRDEQKPGETQ